MLFETPSTNKLLAISTLHQNVSEKCIIFEWSHRPRHLSHQRFSHRLDALWTSSGILPRKLGVIEVGCGTLHDYGTILKRLWRKCSSWTWYNGWRWCWIKIHSV